MLNKKQRYMTTLVTISDGKIDKLMTGLRDLTNNTDVIEISKEDFNKTEMMITVHSEFENEARNIIEECKYKESNY